ncbi:hypothetical protein [Acidithiobacillus sp.]|uniref:hypothetical protein n=1 Tax=Acidithiobacillus sp. TaxID=1872118 RepID=UPI0025BE2E08|nr:hypothetical protein [Acidithiobacillus sp.]
MGIERIDVRKLTVEGRNLESASADGAAVTPRSTNRPHERSLVPPTVPLNAPGAVDLRLHSAFVAA